MCGACPGGAGISRLSAYAALAGIKADVARLLQQAAGRRVGIRAFGDQWVLSTRTGTQRVVPGLEEVAAAVVAGPLDWQAVSDLTGCPVTRDGAGLACAAGPALQEILDTPLDGPHPQLTAGEFTVALLVRAAGARTGSQAQPMPDSAGGMVR